MGRKTITLIAAIVVAAVGAGLVFLYVQGVDQRAQADSAPVQVLTAVKQVEAGETVKDAQAAGKLELAEIPGAAVLSGALTETDSISNMTALAPIYPGEQIISSRFGDSGSQSRITIPDKSLAISVELGDPQRVAGFVQPGSEVAIFSTVGDKCNSGAAAGDNLLTRLLLPEATVIAVGQTGTSNTTTTAEGEETVEAISTTILTLALEQTESEKVILASQTTCLNFALLTDKSNVTPTDGTSFDDLFDQS